MSFTVKEASRNRLLSATEPQDLARLAPHLTRVTLNSGEIVCAAGESVPHVYFVESGFISALALLSDGRSLEVGLVGCDGAEGASALVHVHHTATEAVCQTVTQALRIPISVLQELLPETSSLRYLLANYLQARHNELVQIAVCNAHHGARAKLARWLLTAADRSDYHELGFTHDLISLTHGVRRSTVTIEAGRLQRAGIIRYQHGTIAIVDRSRLELAACECYATIRAEHERLRRGARVSTATLNDVT